MGKHKQDLKPHPPAAKPRPYSPIAIKDELQIDENYHHISVKEIKEKKLREIEDKIDSVDQVGSSVDELEMCIVGY